jgi:hypothetical protein
VRVENDGNIRPLTEVSIFPNAVETLYSEEDVEEAIGIKIEYRSNDVCKVEGNSLKYYGFATEIYCNEDYEEPGRPNVIEILRADSCQPVVVLEHSVGCPTYTVAGLTRFLQK